MDLSRSWVYLSFFAISISLGALSAAAIFKGTTYYMYVGTYTSPEKSKGIYAYRFDPSTGNMEPAGLVAETPNPTFLAVDPEEKFIFAVNEISQFQDQKAGSVSSFSTDRKTGKLTPINVVSSKGAGPCHLAVDHTGKALVVANYVGGSAASFRIGLDGKLSESVSFDQHQGSGPDKERQEAPHGHCVNISPNNRYVISADLGLDKVFIYKLKAETAEMTENSPPFAKVDPGSGPRHFAFHPSGKYGYVINEMKSTVTAFRWEGSRGALTQMQTISTLPEDFKGQSTTAEVFVHPNGKFLYGSNRGHDSIAVFSIDAEGQLKPVQHISTQGQMPRAFVIDPSGRFLLAANQKSDTIVEFQIDQSTGKLTSTGKTVDVGAPVSMVFVKATK